VKLSRRSLQCVVVACLCYAAPAFAAQKLAASTLAVAVPLHTSLDQIVDRHSRPISLLSVNWYGFDQKDFVAGGLDHASLDEIADQIVAMGFNSVRLPWANETLEKDPIVAAAKVSANPLLAGKRSMELMDVVIAALTRRHIMVILDNHMSDADWCCSNEDGDALWSNALYTEAQWIADWQTIVTRYRDNPLVIGADLRNELRGTATWGGTDAATDWRAAAIRGGNAVLAVNPHLLIFVEGPKYSTDFTAVAAHPIELSVAHRLVLSPHSYSIGHTYKNYEEAAAALHREYDPLLHAQMKLPLWVGEFGNCTRGDCAASGADWLRWFARFCNENGIRNVSYWALNATQSSGRTRVYDQPEGYGLLTTDWQRIQSPEIVRTLQSISNPSMRSEP
jgi:endoglucanase